MKFAGVDLHKKSMTVCVVNEARERLKIKSLRCQETVAVREFFAELGEFQVVVEATGSYEWFVQLVEPLAKRVVLAHPAKMRIIAESKRKSDKFDAQVLANQLALDEVPESYRPTPRQREHRQLVRQRCFVQKRITAVKNKMRRILSNCNADFPELFSEPIADVLARVPVLDADRFTLEQLDEQRQLYVRQVQAVDQRLKAFAKSAPAQEQEDREILQSIPQVGSVTTEAVLAEVAGPERFSSQKKGVSFAGLAPGKRESAGKCHELHIEKTGSSLLRWILVETAWRLVQRDPFWSVVFEDLSRRKGRKKAIVAVARRLLTLMLGLLHRREKYDGKHIRETGTAVILRANPDLRDPQPLPKPERKRTPSHPRSPASQRNFPAATRPAVPNS